MGARFVSFVTAFFVLAPFSAIAQQPRAPAPITDAEVARFVEQLIAAGHSADCEAFEQLLSAHAFVARGLEGIPLRPSERMTLESSMRRQLMYPHVGVSARLCEGIAEVRIVFRGRGTRDGRDTVRFRAVKRDSGAFFLDYELGRNAAGEVQAVDLFVATQGTWLSEQVRDSAVPVGASDSAFARSLDARGRLLMGHFSTIRLVQEAASTGDLARMDELVATLPELLRNDQLVLMIRVTGCQQSGNSEAYQRAIEDFERAHPDSVAAAILSFDARLLRRDYEGAMTSLEQMQTLLGPDPFVDLMRAIVLTNLARYPEALTMATRAAEADPDYFQAWGLVLDIATALSRDADALVAYRALARLGAVPARVATDAVFARLRARPEFRSIVVAPSPTP